MNEYSLDSLSTPVHFIYCIIIRIAINFFVEYLYINTEVMSELIFLHISVYFVSQESCNGASMLS